MTYKTDSIFGLDTTRFEHVLEFDSLDAAVRFVEVAPNISNKNESEEGEESFNGTKSLDEALELATYGWRDGTKKVYEQARKLDYVIEDYRHEMVESDVYDVQGHYVDIGAFLDGEPECMVNTEDRMDLTRVATIYMNCSYSGSVSEKEVFRRGAMVCQLVDTLEKLGVRVDLSALDLSTGNGNCLIATRVKRPNDILDMDRISYVCAHRSFLRRIGFALMERVYKEVPYGYGSPANLKEEEMPSDALYLDTNLGKYLKDDKAAAEWLDRMVKQYLQSSSHV